MAPEGGRFPVVDEVSLAKGLTRAPDGCRRVLFNSVSIIIIIWFKIIAIASSWALLLAASTASVPSLIIVKLRSIQEA